MIHASRPVTLKIYGERNSGTNYLSALVGQNLDVTLLPGRVSDQDVLTRITRRLNRFLPATHGWHEAARDRFFEATFARNLGWKHMNPDPERIGAEALASVRFLMVVKNPYAWALSLYKRPYHTALREGESFEEFLVRPLAVMARRENIGLRPLTAPEVWTCKMKGYLALDAAAAHAVIERYEAFLEDEEAALDRVAGALGVTRCDRHQPIEAGVKQADRAVSQADYASYYLQEQWRAHLSPAAIEAINARLDPDLVARLGYQLLSPEEGQSPA